LNSTILAFVVDAAFAVVRFVLGRSVCMRASAPRAAPARRTDPRTPTPIDRFHFFPLSNIETSFHCSVAFRFATPVGDCDRRASL
jgi:hypothetical protein